MSKKQLSDANVLFILTASLFLFYPALFFAKTAFLTSDHWQEHYPWAVYLYESVRNGVLPFWTTANQCGFPIAAEGQVGVFYLPNLLFGLLLPNQAAYSYQHIFHFLLAGFGLYLYMRSVKEERPGALLAAFIFMFGSAYAGAFYNLNSLKTVAWLPISLYLFERFYQDQNRIVIITLGAAVGLCILAGYPQIAVYTCAVLYAYIFARIFFVPDKNRRGGSTRVLPVFYVILSMGIGYLLAKPQLDLTLELAGLSNRLQLTEDFAYVGSMSPAAVSTFVFPGLRTLFRANNLYIGILPLFFLTVALFDRESGKRKLVKLWVCIAIVCFLLALGKWNPLYVGLIKLTQFYGFRVPSKFMVYLVLACAVLSGFGLNAFFRTKCLLALPKKKASRVIHVFTGMILILIVCVILAYAAVILFRAPLYSLGQWIVQTFVYGKSGHPYSLEFYYARLDPLLDYAGSLLSPANWRIWWPITLSCLAVVIVRSVLRDNRSQRIKMACIGAFIFIDLYAASFVGIRKDFHYYEKMQPKGPVMDALQKEITEHRVSRVYSFRERDDRQLIEPHTNSLYGYAAVGAYTPLVLKRYYETVGMLGNVNDSIMVHFPTLEYVMERWQLIDFLNVSHVLSTTPLYRSSLELIEDDPENSHYLYVNKTKGRSAYFISEFARYDNWDHLKEEFMRAGFDPTDIVLVLEKDFTHAPLDRIRGGEPVSSIQPLLMEEHYQSWNLKTNEPGFFVIPQNAYPKWEAVVNGKPQPIIPAYGFLQSLWFGEPGEYQIEIRFRL